MRTGPLDRDTFEAIEAYVLGTMPQPERDAFEERMRADGGLREEVEQQQEHIHAVELGGVQRALRDIVHAPEATQAGRTGWVTYLKYAAVVTLLLGAAAWYVLKPTPGERLFAEHFSPDPGLPVAMSTTQDLAFQDAMVDYKLEAYEEARTKWAGLLVDRPLSDTLRYYSAMAALGARDIVAAIPLLDAVAADQGSPYARSAAWYLFLAHVHQGDTAAASSVRSALDPEHARRAATIQEAWR